MCKSFCHLHNHTEYSLLDGANRIKDLVAKAKEFEMPAMAITDHGVMFGAMEFYFECLEQGIKPLIGMEAYVAAQGIDSRLPRETRDSFHLLLLAKNEEGYRNLCQLHSIAALKGFYYRPRIDHAILREHARGLIGSTTCMGSEVNQALIEGDYDRALATAKMYKDIFDEGSYIVELQDHGLPDQKIMNEGLLRIAKELDLPLVATNDSHYLCRSDAEPHDVLLAIGTGSLLSDEKRFKFKGEEFYLKSPQEMAEVFRHVPQALENTAMVADMCSLDIKANRNLMPDPELPEGMNPTSYLRYLAQKGLKERVKAGWRLEAEERLEYELGIIEKTGYESYFLLVREFATYTRGQGIMFGVRGSAAGSLVSYTLGITDVDPVEYDLTFERFLNPERVSMPDIDMDFEDSRRDEVIHWVTEKYGKDRVAQIVTFGTLGAKAAIRDSARVMGFLPSEADKVAKLIPTGPGWSIKKALSDIPDFRQAVENDQRIEKLVSTARSIEGLSRHSGVHAAGVVISSTPLAETVPLWRGSDNQAVTAYEMGILEKLGLLKMDFLGLSNLTVVARAIDNIRQTLGVAQDAKLVPDHPVLDGITQIPLDDERTYEMLAKGDTVGVFQLESGGMRRNIIELKPQNVGELSAMVALYRPGPMGEIPTYINSKFGRRPITYLHELMEPILSSTYGVIVYQDQVLKLVQALAGFSLGKADILRRAMGKKSKKDMDKMMPQFFDGCAERGIDRETAERIWELLVPFSGYAFNKAHAVCYAILAYQTAYLKANYPVEYMAALLGCYRDKEDRVINFIEACRHMKIPILAPDINASGVDFTVEVEGGKKSIRFGMAAIKGVGVGLVQKIIEEREMGPFTHLYEFCSRCKPHGLNKTALEALIKAGALGSINPNRNTLLEHLEAGMAYAAIQERNRDAGQESLFGGADEPDSDIAMPTLPEAASLERRVVLAMEKEVMGIYISDHPLRGLEGSLRSNASHVVGQLTDLEADASVTLAGILSGVQHTVSKKTGQKMCRITLEDFTGQVNGLVTKDTYTKYFECLERDLPVVLKGRLSFDDRSTSSEKEPFIFVSALSRLKAPTLDLSFDKNVAGIIHIRINRATRTQMKKLKDLVQRNPGDFEVVLQFNEAPDEAPIVLLERVSCSQEYMKLLRGTLDDAEVELVRTGYSADESEPELEVQQADVGPQQRAGVM